MNKSYYSFEEFSSSSSLIRAFINESDEIKPFSDVFFNENAILNRAKSKDFSIAKREKLVSVLKTQNKELLLSGETKINTEKLADQNTFCITTGHQLNMGSGPLYTLYKIIEIINWCEKLNESQSDNHFVPIFWMATEDHDFEEINHVNLFGSKIEWQHHSVANSIVGRIDTNTTVDFVGDVLEKFRDEELKSKVRHFLSVYSNSENLASANRQLINNLFGEFGLVIIDGDSEELKKDFLPIAKSEIENAYTFQNVSETNKSLESSGFHQQVFVRESNLFYIEPSGERVRVEKKNDHFLIGETSYNHATLIELLEEYPERFSPNALLRPLYQETILPNIVYVGGGGEIAYWLQLKSAFESFGVEFPLLKVRESVILVDERMDDLMKNSGYSILELKGNIDEILKDFVSKNQAVELSLSEQKNSLVSIKESVLKKAVVIDKNATTFIEAEFQRMENQLDKMEKKFVASEKKNQEKAIKQLKNLQNKLYPNGGGQERYDNYLSYIHIPDFIDKLKIELKERMTVKAAIQVINI